MKKRILMTTYEIQLHTIMFSLIVKKGESLKPFNQHVYSPHCFLHISYGNEMENLFDNHELL